MKPFLSFALLLLVSACTMTQPNIKNEVVTPQLIESNIANGSFSKAEALIKEYLHSNSLPYKERQKWLFQIEKMNRIRMDFSVSDSTVISYLLNYYDSIPSLQMGAWEQGKALEYKMIDDKKYYFKNAARNLFRISAAARKQYERIHGSSPDSLQRFLSAYIPSIVKDAQTEGSVLVDPVSMEVTYTLSVNPNAVPPGELVRAWMPMPRTDIARQTDVQLISFSQPNYILSSDLLAHTSIYMEKKAVADEPTIFSYTFSYTSYAEWYNFNATDIKLYNTQSNVYQNFTTEQPPHIIFSDRIRKMTEEVVGNEQNPYLKVKKIYDWIDRNFPWASAREYSTIDNIPEYVLDNRHGDCGQVTLLFITMARCAGVPAKWQSGWMMHPGNKNLHDWAEVYYEGIGWVPVDQSFGRVRLSQDPDVYWFYTKGIDAYRLVVNQDTGKDFYPVKMHPRSETVDFQRGEVEWQGGNLYFNNWTYQMNIAYKPAAQKIPESSVPVQKVVKSQVEAKYGFPDNRTGSRDIYYPNNSRMYADPVPGTYPSNTQFPRENSMEDISLRNYERSYLRNNDGGVGQSSFFPNMNVPSKIEDNSLSLEYLNQMGYGSGYRYPEDRYISPTERAPLPGNSYYPSYSRDLNDPRSIPPPQNDPSKVR